MSSEQPDIMEESPFESWPTHIRVHLEKDFTGVPQTDGSYARLDRSKIPKDAGKLLADDYVSAFSQIFNQGGGLRVKPPSFFVHASKTASRPDDHTSADQDFAGRLEQPSGREDGGKLKRSLKMDTLLQRKNTRKKFSESDGRSLCGRSIRSASRDSTSSLSSTDTRSLASTCTSSEFVPVRQSERRIRAQLLQNAVLDDDLGIGIGDDENQRRSWHKPRVYNKEVVQHRCSQGRILLQVQQASGHLEWLEQSTVEEGLVERYKAQRLKPGEQLIAPGRKPNRPSSATAGRRPGRPRKHKANEGCISALLGPDDQHSGKSASVPSSYDGTSSSSSSSSDSEWESEISI